MGRLAARLNRLENALAQGDTERWASMIHIDDAGVTILYNRPPRRERWTYERWLLDAASVALCPVEEGHTLFLDTRDGEEV